MGLVLGRIDIETPKFKLVEKEDEKEIRQYEPCLVAEVAYTGTHFKSGADGGFMTLAGYIGAIGNANNIRAEQARGGDSVGEGGSEKIAMTAPVITQEKCKIEESEKIAMTAPVITAERGDESEKTTIMQFVLPSKYTMDTIPKPKDPKVTVKEQDSRLMGVVRFSGMTTYGIIDEKAASLRAFIERKGYTVDGDYILARYNPPFTVPFLRTNEVMYPLKKEQ